VFPDSGAPSLAGAAPQNGTVDDPEHNEWLSVNDYFAIAHPDAAHATRPPGDLYGPRSLVQVLAHELDHLKNFDHIDQAGIQTTHSQQCSGLPG